MNILVVATAAGCLTCEGGRRIPAGYWLGDLAAAVRRFREAGYAMTFATPGGVPPTPEPSSEEPFSWSELRTPRSLGSLDEQELEEFDAVFFPGGHGCLEDLFGNHRAGRLLRHFHERLKITALVGHGQTALLSAREGARWPYRGYTMTACTNEEERRSAFWAALPYRLEDELRNEGALFAPGPAFQCALREDRELVTGQNPASAAAVADAVVRRLEAAPATAG